MIKEVKRYAERDAYELDKAGNYYCRHVSAMTGEGLHSKSDIAAELGWRDMQIDALLAERDAAKTAAERYQLLASTLLADCTGTAMNTQEGALYRALNEIEHVNSTAEIDAIFDAALQGEQP